MRPTPIGFDFDAVQSNRLCDGRVHLKSCAIRDVTLAALDTSTSHGRVCRDEAIVDAVQKWLGTGRLLKMRRRTRRNSVNRPGRIYFSRWDGDEGSFGRHRVGN